MKKDISRIRNILRERPYNVRTPLDRFVEKARAVLPEEMHDSFKPLDISEGVLTVACSTSNAAYVLRRHEHELLVDEVKAIRTMLSTWR